MTLTEAQTPRADPRSPLCRLEALFDAASFTAFTAPTDCGVLAGRGLIEGAPVIAFATAVRMQGGALGIVGCAQIVSAIDAAVADGCPVVGIWHSGGARLREGVASLDAVGRVFAATVRASGTVPQLSVVLGPAAGGAAYGPALSDIVILGPAGRIFVTGPDVVRSVTGEDVDMARLGGPEPHGRRSGVVHVVADTDATALSATRELAALLGQRGTVGSVPDRELRDLLPSELRRAYDVRPLLDALLDAPGVELHPRWAANVVTSLGRLGGRTVGVVANNPLRLGGCLDAAAADKAARFVRMCDALDVPLIVVVDVPGYLPGVAQEWDGVVRRGAKLLHAFAESVVPRVTLVTHKAYGGAYIAMNSASLGATRVFAWPDAEIAVMGAPAAVEILHRRELSGVAEPERGELKAALAADHAQEAGGLARAVEVGVVHEVLDPSRTRSALAAAIAAAPDRRGRHGNIPL